jgi:hypothetical protein
MTDAEINQAPTPDAYGWEWAIVEVFGHRRHAGRMREEERFGAKMLRIDVPVFETPEAADSGPIERWESRWYGGGSIFSLSLTDERSVRRANRPYAPPARISFRASEAEPECDPFGLEADDAAGEEEAAAEFGMNDDPGM